MLNQIDMIKAAIKARQKELAKLEKDTANEVCELFDRREAGLDWKESLTRLYELRGKLKAINEEILELKNRLSFEKQGEKLRKKMMA